jgi:hypothetical protein
MTKPLDIYARLRVSTAGHQLSVRADGRLITIEIPSLLAGRELLKRWRPRHAWGKSLGDVRAMMTYRDLQLEFRLSGRMIARLGVGTRPSLSSWLLGLSPLELRPLQMLLAVASRNKRRLDVPS